VDGPGDHEAECPKCGYEFTATLEGDDPPEQTRKSKRTDRDDEPVKKANKGPKEKAQSENTRSGKKAAKRRDDDEDDEDDAPRKKRKTREEPEEGGKNGVIIAGVVAVVVLLIGLGGAIYAITAGSPKKPEAPAEVAQQQPVAPAANSINPIKPTPPDATAPAGPAANPPTGTPSGTNPTPPTGPGAGSGGPKPPGPGLPAPPKPNPKDEEIDLATFLPPPPKLKITGSLVPTGKPIVRPPTVPPLSPDEDPFVRAISFRPDGALPALPKLPPANQRPNLALDAGGHTGRVWSVFFTQKGDKVITVGEDKLIRICDVATGDTVRTIRVPSGPGNEGSLRAAALSPNGKLLAVGGVPLKTAPTGTVPGKVAQPPTVPVFVINIETGALATTLKARGDEIDALDFSRTGNEIAVGSVVIIDDKLGPGIAQLFRVKDGTLLGMDERAHNGGFREIRYHPDPKKKVVATLGRDSTVKVWDFIDPKRNYTVRIGAQVKPTCLDWSSDGRTLAVGGGSGEILLGTVDGQHIRTYKARNWHGAPLQIVRLRYAPGDREFVACGVGGGAKPGWAGVIDAETGEPKADCTEHTNTAMSVNVSPDGTLAVSNGGNQNETLVWETATGKLVRRLVASGSGIWAVGWAKDGKSLAWGTEPPLAANNSSVGKLEGVFRLDEFGIGGAPDPAKYAQAVEADDTVQIKQLGQSRIGVVTDGREPVAVALPGKERVYSVSVLPRGNALIVGGAHSLYLVNPAGLAIMKEFVGHTGQIMAVAPSPDGRYFVSGSSDQTIRIWRRDQEDPIMSIYVSGREWIAWTPQGYYACSSQGEQLIAWQVNSGALKLPQVHPAARFRPSMYQPAILKYLIPAGDMPRALAMAQKFDKALVQTTSVADVLPPEVTLDGFGDTEVKVDQNALTVKATAKSTKHPITAMRLLVDGRPFQGSAGVKRFDAGRAGEEAAAAWEVPLVPGTHTLAVIADSPVSKGMSKVGIVVRPGEPPKPNLYVLAMGVSDYPGDMKLTYCASDAKLLAEAFPKYSKNVFANIEVKLLTDHAASKKGILDGLDWLKSKMTPQDVGIVSFSGHGMRDPFGRFYLVTADVKADDPEHTCLPGDVFKDRLDNMPGRLVAILDACHSGTVAEKAAPPARADTLVRDLTAEDSGVIVMCASLGREYASESPLTKAGFYTFGLVEGLSGLADIDGDGTVYIHELDMYATARVRQLSHGRQNPSLGRPPTVRPFAIAKPDGPPKP
jgi:WD40 repeat protein